MKTKLIAAIVASASALSFVSCSQCQIQGPIGGDYAKTTPITIDTTDCKLICGRVSGESKGVKLLGFIPIKSPSESVAVSNMYQNARDRGCKVEGESVAFANTSVERSSQNYILFSRPTIKATGDLVQYVGNAHQQGRIVNASGGASGGSSGGGGIMNLMFPFL